MSKRPEPLDIVITEDRDMANTLLDNGGAIVLSNADLRGYIGRTVRVSPVGPDADPDSAIMISLVAKS